MEVTARSTARREFLGDVITGAVEGGTGYWAQVSQYQYEMDGEVRVCVGRRHGDDPRAVLHPLRDDETGYEEEGKELTLDVVEAGIARIADPTFKINSTLRGAILAASATNDAGEIDAEGADYIVQAGLLGEVVYG